MTKINQIQFINCYNMVSMMTLKLKTYKVKISIVCFTFQNKFRIFARSKVQN